MRIVCLSNEHKAAAICRIESDPRTWNITITIVCLFTNVTLNARTMYQSNKLYLYCTFHTGSYRLVQVHALSVPGMSRGRGDLAALWLSNRRFKPVLFDYNLPASWFSYLSRLLVCLFSTRTISLFLLSLCVNEWLPFVCFQL